MNPQYDVIVVGGGAAGFFSALTAKARNPAASVLIIEKSSQLLNKVRISGGGRCNVTHACFDALPLTQNYPRGNKALIGPFTRFQPLNMIEWLEERGVKVKAEEDGRMFPITDSSQTIIECFLREAKKLGVEITCKENIDVITKQDELFHLQLSSGSHYTSKKVILCTGSSPHGHKLACALGHSASTLVPSLFTFNVPTSPLLHLSGIAVNPAKISIKNTQFSQTGPVLITHWGFSGPAALKLSAWAARYLHEHHYKVVLEIDWLPRVKSHELLDKLIAFKAQNAKKTALQTPFELPRNLWKQLGLLANISEEKKYAELSNQDLQKMVGLLKNQVFNVDGKTTYKEEFVTCGGINLDEVNFKTMESKRCPGLYFAGEILDIDAVTGGFNFQNAWTTGWIAGSA